MFRLRKFQRSCSDAHLWLFHVAPDWPLLVAIDDSDHVSCAILSFCWIPLTEDATDADREQFDAVFAEERSRAVAIIGLPLVEGRDPDSAHRWAVWQGATGLLVLQQSNYDLQVGTDVNYWVQRWRGEIPAPSSPFIDWLMKFNS